jgi:hypothetical protein
MFEEWMLSAAYDVASILPAEHDEALAVLALAKQLVLKVNKPYVTRLRAAKPRRKPAT